MKLKRRILSVLLTLAVMVTFMPFISQQAFAASSSKVQVVTKAKANNGNTSYSYNKKGLVTKVVTKKSSKDASTDNATTTTTTYKYNKKNAVTKRTTTVVDKVTYWQTDKTTGKTRTANLGTVTKTTKFVTNYTVNKKGLATKSVTTITETKSGSEASTSKSRPFLDEGSSRSELVDGRLVADSYTDDNGNRVYTFWTGAVNDAVADRANTTTYVDNGNGTYREVSENNYTGANYDTNMTYKGGDIISAEVVLKGGANTSFNKSESIHEDKTVITTTYKYDKKKRVKSENSVFVKTDVYTEVSESGGSRNSDGSSHSYTYNTPRTETTTTTSSSTTTYTYDKKGHAKKVVVSDKGISNETYVEVNGLTNESGENVYSDGTRQTWSSVSSGTDSESVYTEVTAGGTKTTTTDSKPYTSVYTENGVAEAPVAHVAKVTTKNWTVRYNQAALGSTDVTTYAYDKNGNRKSAKETINGTEYVTQKNETYGNSLYELVNAENLEPGEVPYQKLETVKVLVNHTHKYNSKFETSVKNGTKRVQKLLEMVTSSHDGSSSTGYDLDGRVVYTLKAKKLKGSAAKIAEQQQWAIQNGSVNGMVGF